jgi:lysophospholipase L1-like esterase
VNFRKIVIGGIVIALLFFACQFFKPVHYVHFPPSANGDWIAYGDSLTAGLGAADGNDYPALLSQRLGVAIQNLGIPGDTTQGGLNRVEEALKLQPRVVLLCLGGNDGLQGGSATQMISNLSQIIDRFHGSGSFVVLIGVHSASLRDTNSKRFHQLAKEKNVFYVPDILDGVLGHPALMSDYIHPNDAGYKVIAERLEKILTPLLPSLKK